MLTLVSNERIPLTPEMRLVFEVSSVANATPATVSRAGMLFVNDSDVTWRAMVESWLASRPEAAAHTSRLAALFSKYVDKTLDLLASALRPASGTKSASASDAELGFATPMTSTRYHPPMSFILPRDVPPRRLIAPA